ncbi:sigma-70 family RNA polymerase sigma factor [Planctomycetales bacterium ZRK34]|nr:sigma-70 family RNA polymerase sigma factor [Planctomycetales bacterium ZRK34]
MTIDRDAAIRRLAGHHSDLVSFIVIQCRDFHLAEDIYQDVLVEAVQYEGTFESEQHLMRWARKIARNRVIDASRKGNQRRTTIDTSVLDLIEAEWDNTPAPAEGELVEMLRACLSELADPVRKLIELRYRENLSGQELAQRLDRPRASVYTTVCRAHRALAECIRRRMAKPAGQGGER